MNIYLHRAVYAAGGALLTAVWFVITGGATVPAAVLLLVAQFVAFVAVVIFRSAAREHDRVVKNQAEQALSPCQYRPIHDIPCGRAQGHAGPHLVRPSDVNRLGFVRPEF